MSKTKSIHARNYFNEFSVGQIAYSLIDGIGSYGMVQDDPDGFQFTALMAPKTFLNLVPPTDFPSVAWLSRQITGQRTIKDKITDRLSNKSNDDRSFEPPLLKISPGFFAGQISEAYSHEGRNRTKVSQMLQPHMPVPVQIDTNDNATTPSQFVQISKGVYRQGGGYKDDDFVEGPLFRCFFHAGKRYGVVKTPNDDGEFDYSAKEVPYSRDISAPE